MIAIIRHSIFFTLALILLVFSSCSTKKNTWANRSYHNTTAKYNGYFNGNESLKKGVKKIYKEHKDDYSKTLPVYRFEDLAKEKNSHTYMDKAIRKGSVVIQKHSMKIKGKEYCRWIDDNYLLVGKGYFYKGEFEEALKTFRYIESEYSKNEIRFDAAIWSLRSYVQKKDFLSAEIKLSEIRKDRRLPKKVKLDFALASAEYYLATDNTEHALEQLKKADELIKRKRKKTRYNYIMAQIYQQQKKYTHARQQYQKVAKSNEEYEMRFNAKMNLARSLETGSEEVEKTKEKLIKMTKDDKNKEYLDQIYYTIGRLAQNNADTSEAKSSFTLSTRKSLNNNHQKAISFLALGEIEYEQGNYAQSKTHYDSTVFYMDQEFRLYEKTKETHSVLTKLVTNLETIILEDSVQFLARLPKKELNEAISQIIQIEKAKKQEKLQQQRNKNQIINESIRNRGLQDQFGTNTSGGKWYFYNPATLSFGMSEFRKKWGKRKLEDDWRRKNKKIDFDFETDSTSLDSSTVQTNTNKQDPRYYLERLPSSETDFINSDNKIKEAYYQAGTIYRESLKEYLKSTQMFTQITLRFSSDTIFAPLAYYNIYLNQKDQNKISEYENTKNTIIQKYPNSIYAQKITDPEFNKKQTQKKKEAGLRYEQAYLKYSEKNFLEALELAKDSTGGTHKTKYSFLRALCYIKLNETAQAKNELQKIVDGGNDGEIAAKAQTLLGLIKNPSKMEKANNAAVSGTPYFFKEDSPHMTIIIMPKKASDINYLKTLISDYHSLYFENETYEITAMLLGLTRHIIMVKTFESAKQASEYSSTLTNDKKIIEQLNKTEFRVMAISLENFNEFYRNKDMKGYYEFYLNNYIKNN